MGGGKVGAYLARELRRTGHAVLVIERQNERAHELAESSDALVIHGDGTDLGLLQQLDVRPNDFFLALTGVDEENLVACQLATTAFGVSRVLARLNDPRNRQTFTAMEIPVVSVTDLLVEVITRELDLAELMRVALFDRGEVSLFEVEIPEDRGSRRVDQLELPPSSVLVAIRRKGTLLVPEGSTEISGGDRVLAVGLVELEDDVRDELIAPTEAAATEETGT